jgi:hypothetical protein
MEKFEYLHAGPMSSCAKEFPCTYAHNTPKEKTDRSDRKIISSQPFKAQCIQDEQASTVTEKFHDG